MRTKNLKYLLPCGVVLVGAAFLWWRGGDSSSSGETPTTTVDKSALATKNPRLVRHAAAAVTNGAPSLTASSQTSDAAANDSDILAEAEAITEKLDRLLDGDKTDAILAEARRLKKHPNPEVRSRVAFALNWVGIQALPELTTMLGDPDPEVEDDIVTFWKDRVGEVANENDQADLLAAAAEVFGDDISLDFLDDLITDIGMLDEVVALPRLMEMLKLYNDKERAALVSEAIEGIVMPDDDGLGKDALLREAATYLKELEAEKAAEAAEEGAAPDDLADAAAIEPPRRFPVPRRK